jgi:hypothetical protein
MTSLPLPPTPTFDVFTISACRPTTSGIYRITCTSTLDTYIGQAANFDSRWRAHLCDLRGKRHHNRNLSAAVAAHGMSALEFAVIEPCEWSQLGEREKFWINTIGPKFNKRGGYRSRRKQPRPRERVYMYCGKKSHQLMIDSELVSWVRTKAAELGVATAEIFIRACTEFAQRHVA